MLRTEGWDKMVWDAFFNVGCWKDHSAHIIAGDFQLPLDAPQEAFARLQYLAALGQLVGTGVVNLTYLPKDLKAPQGDEEADAFLKALKSAVENGEDVSVREIIGRIQASSQSLTMPPAAS